MKIIEANDYQEMSQLAADYIINLVKENPNLTLGLATGGTPKNTYKLLIADHKNNGTSYNSISTFNLDEYIGLAPEDVNSYHYYMNQALFKHIDIKSQNIFIPNGLTSNIERECKEYEAKIAAHGGIDLQLLGIGANGHIGFNEPGTSFHSNTHVIDLAPSTREANARFFDSKDDVPNQAITMGIASIMASKKILLLVSGEGKSNTLKRLLSEEGPDESFPASILKKHPHVTIIADKKALNGVGVTN
jgi:glucosamine-6-phosphate deaminase